MVIIKNQITTQLWWIEYLSVCGAVSTGGCLIRYFQFFDYNMICLDAQATESWCHVLYHAFCFGKSLDGAGIRQAWYIRYGWIRSKCQSVAGMGASMTRKDSLLKMVIAEDG